MPARPPTPRRIYARPDTNVIQVRRRFWFSNRRPRYIGAYVMLNCWCGATLSMECLQAGRLEELEDFLNSHSGCAPKEEA